MDKVDKLFFSPDEVIFREGDLPTGMYIIVEGTVELKKRGDKGETLLRTLSKPNEFFGEMALIDGKPRSATAVATRPTSLHLVDGAAFEKMIATNGAFATKIIKVLSDRIRQTNIQLQELVDTDHRTRIALGIMDFALRFGRKSAGEARVLSLPEMKTWVNGHIGVSREEIDAVVFRMLKSGELVEPGQRGQDKDCLILSGTFIRANDRRHIYDKR